MEVRPEERLLPLFWALDGFKQRQEDFPNPPLTELKGPLPASEKAAAELAGAIERADLDASERAVVVLARDRGARQTMEQLWPYGCRNGGMGGHAAIVVSSCFRALETLGWEHAEPVLRFVLRDVYSLGGRGKPDPYFLPNTARVDRHLDKLPPGWAGGIGDRAATLELFGLLRTGKADQACELAVKQLLGGVGAQAVWDAVHLATAELMVRHSSGWGVASRPLHSNTSAGALHYAFRTSDSARDAAPGAASGGRLDGRQDGLGAARSGACATSRSPNCRRRAVRCRPLPARPWRRSSRCCLPGTITGTPRLRRR